MEKEEISIYGVKPGNQLSIGTVFLLLSLVGMGTPLYFFIAGEISFIESLVVTVLFIALLSLWVWYNEQDMIVLSPAKIIFKKRLLTYRFRPMLSLNPSDISQMHVTRIINLDMAPKSLFTIVHNDGKITEKWLGLVFEQEQETLLRDFCSRKGIRVVFEE